MNRLILLINGRQAPFLSADINFSIEQLAHTFNCTIAPMMILQAITSRI